jgi:hypothetical protein
VVQVIEVQLRDAELVDDEVPVKVQLTVMVLEKKLNHRYKSKKLQEKSRRRSSERSRRISHRRSSCIKRTALVTENTD